MIGPAAKEAIPALLQALNQKEGLLPGQIQIAVALVRIDSGGQTEVAVAALEKLIKGGYTKGAEEAAKALMELGPKALPVLIQMLNDDRRGRRRAAASALGELGRKAEPSLVMVRNDPRPTARRAVVEACGKIDAALTRDILLEALHDPAWSVREAAVRALAKDGNPTKEVAAALMEALKDEDSDVQDTAAEVLRRVNPQATEKP